MPKIISLDELDAEMTAICRLIDDAQCVALPTETVYGLAADATNGLAVARIFELKQRPKFNPLICHVNDMAMAERLGSFDAISMQLAKAFWPGPLTLILPLRENSSIHPLVTAGLGTIGMRLPLGPIAKIITACGKPLAAPSANRSGAVSTTSANHVAKEFSETGLTIIDGGPCEVGIESTIVKVEEGEIKILRPGAITPEMIETLTGIKPQIVTRATIEAPGMMQSHYAPKARVVTNQHDCPKGAALLAFGDGRDCNRINSCQTINLSPQGNLTQAAANLYDAIKALDESGTDVISVEPIPGGGLGTAINDRLERAAAPRREAET